MIDRRAFLGTVALAALGAPRLGEARPASARVPRVGVLGEANPIPWMVRTPVVDIECRWAADARGEPLSALASELVALDVDVIVALGAASARAARESTARVPIVVVADPELGEDGLVASLAASMGNVSWLTAPSETGMARQRLRMLGRFGVPLRRVAVVFNPDNAANSAAVERLSGPAPDALVPCPARSVEDVERVVLSGRHDAADALLVLADTLFTVHARRLVELTAQARLPAAYGARVFVDAGGLIAVYGDTGEIIRRTASLVRRILGGETPATLSSPRLRPQAALNLAAARRLGLEVPRTLIARPTEL